MREQPRLHVVVRAGNAAAAKAALESVKAQAYPRKRVVLLTPPVDGGVPGWARRLVKEFPGVVALAGGSALAVLGELAPRQDDFIALWPAEDAAHPARLAGIVRRLEAESAAATALAVRDEKSGRAALLDFGRAGEQAPDTWVATPAALADAEAGAALQPLADVDHLSLRVFPPSAAARAAALISRHALPVSAYDESAAGRIGASLALGPKAACEVVASCGRVLFQFEAE